MGRALIAGLACHQQVEIQLPLQRPRHRLNQTPRLQIVTDQKPAGQCHTLPRQRRLDAERGLVELQTMVTSRRGLTCAFAKEFGPEIMGVMQQDRPVQDASLQLGLPLQKVGCADRDDIS